MDNEKNTKREKKKLFLRLYLFNLMINSQRYVREKSQAINKYVCILVSWLKHTILVNPSYLFHWSKSLKGAERLKSPCLVSFSRYIMGTNLHITLYCSVMHHQQSRVFVAHACDNETFIPLSHIEWNRIEVK